MFRETRGGGIVSDDRQRTSDEWTEQVNKRSAMTDHAQRATVFKTTVCVEFPDGEIVTTCTEERANLIANAAQAHAAGRREGLEEAAKIIERGDFLYKDGHESSWTVAANVLRAKAKEAGQ